MKKEPLKGSGSRRYISVSLGKRKKPRRGRNSVIALQLDAAIIYLKDKHTNWEEARINR